jgi:hypothetical protein
MEIGAANAGAANPNNYVRLLFYFWIWHLLPGHEFRIRKSSVILMKYGGFHDWRGSEALSREKAWAVEDSGVSSIRGGLKQTPVNHPAIPNFSLADTIPGARGNGGRAHRQGVSRGTGG